MNSIDSNAKWIKPEKGSEVPDLHFNYQILSIVLSPIIFVELKGKQKLANYKFLKADLLLNKKSPSLFSFFKDLIMPFNFETQKERLS